MKKHLLLAAAIFSVASASAQTPEVGFIDAEALGLSAKPAMTGGTKISETENVTMYYAFDQEANLQNADFNGMKSLIVNGQKIDLVPGIGGNSNPAGINITTGPTAGGCQYHFQVKKDGWLIVPSKISSNKNFYAYEGTYEGSMSLLAYTLGMEIANDAYPDLKYGVYTLPADADGYFDQNAATADDYLLGGQAIAWPIRIFTKNGEAVTAGNGTGAIIFPVYADAVDYWVFATGSKMNTCGFIFVASDPKGKAPDVTVYGPERTDDAGTVIPAKSFAITGEVQTPSESGIADIIADETIDENAPMYNVLGQQVDASYKGLVIKNGKKYINR